MKSYVLERLRKVPVKATDTPWRELISPLFTMFIVVSKHMYNGEVGEQ